MNASPSHSCSVAVALLAFALSICGCWDDPPPSDGDDAGLGDGPLFPLRAGNTWTYRVTHRDGMSVKVNRVETEETVGGSGPHASKQALKVTTTRDSVLQTVTYRAEVGQSVVRYRELSLDPLGNVITEKHWDPHKVHIEGAVERRKVGASWIESYEETRIEAGTTTTESIKDSWFVDAVGDTVSVPAGTFRAIVFQRSDVGTLKTFWYVPGIGKVKEMGGQTEELSAYELVD